MKEFGFWVYTGTGTGGTEGYGEPQWDGLLDDMAEGGMNSLVICIGCKRIGIPVPPPLSSQRPGPLSREDSYGAPEPRGADRLKRPLRPPSSQDTRTWVAMAMEL